MDAWLELALNNPEWVATQRAAWELWNTPQEAGQPAPLFVQLDERNLWPLLDRLAKHFQRVEQRHREASQELLRMLEVGQFPHLYEGKVRQERRVAS